MMKRFSFIFFSILFPLLGEVIDVAIIGGGPSGFSAAIYTARFGLSTVVLLGEEPGGQITLSYSIENYPGFPKGINGTDLAMEMQAQAEKFGSSFINGKVVQVDFSKKPIHLKMESGKEIYAKSVIIASGSRTRWLGIPSEEALKGRGVNSCAVCDGFLFKGKEVVVVGGGDSALEDAIYLADLAKKVTVIHRGEKLRASKALQELAFQQKHIKFVYHSVIEKIQDPLAGVVTGVQIKNLINKKESFIPCDGVFIAIGHIPNTEMFKGKLLLDDLGYILTEPFCTKTGVPGVFAAGDVANPKYRQAVVAAGFGCMAAIDAFHFIKEEGGSQ